MLILLGIIENNLFDFDLGRFLNIFVLLVIYYCLNMALS